MKFLIGTLKQKVNTCTLYSRIVGCVIFCRLGLETVQCQSVSDNLNWAKGANISGQFSLKHASELKVCTVSVETLVGRSEEVVEMLT